MDHSAQCVHIERWISHLIEQYRVDQIRPSITRYVSLNSQWLNSLSISPSAHHTRRMKAHLYSFIHPFITALSIPPRYCLKWLYLLRPQCLGFTVLTCGNLVVRKLRISSIPTRLQFQTSQLCPWPLGSGIVLNSSTSYCNPNMIINTIPKTKNNNII